MAGSKPGLGLASWKTIFHRINDARSRTIGDIRRNRPRSTNRRNWYRVCGRTPETGHLKELSRSCSFRNRARVFPVPAETVPEDLDTMSTTHRRLITLSILMGGPVVGWLINGDRGILFGLIASVLAVVWLVIEERKLM